MHSPMADSDRSVGRGWATVPPEETPPAADAASSCRDHHQGQTGHSGILDDAVASAGAIGRGEATCSTTDRVPLAFEGEVTCSAMDTSRIRKGVQLTCGPGGYAHEVDRLVYVSGHVQVPTSFMIPLYIRGYPCS